MHRTETVQAHTSTGSNNDDDDNDNDNDDNSDNNTNTKADPSNTLRKKSQSSGPLIQAPGRGLIYRGWPCRGLQRWRAAWLNHPPGLARQIPTVQLSGFASAQKKRNVARDGR
ncbi:hypothetical protein BO78DRAFT_393602 [Aspergillus sclerotiicarbonarius CBS 121057]|uniref:Uncharacterized protein n=1 Tax=Aspergillus sclerotiicarbonarius (strain CBS 121057 / IBT 28362) TaxID=1448318 RepID=A0A319ELE0_ASPSB|nr:hypothetical protein BO78DRAFT_393602 [Aspergillus sclerotiicarbonarius CBS 121057]